MIQRINRQIEGLEFSRYAVMSFTITVGSCWGSMAVWAMFTNEAPLWQVAVCAGITMLSNAMSIALAPIKVLVWTFVASVIINLLLLLANVI